MDALFFCKRGKDIQWGKDSLFNKWCWKNRHKYIYIRMKLEHFQTPYTKTNINYFDPFIWNTFPFDCVILFLY